MLQLKIIYYLLKASLRPNFTDRSHLRRWQEKQLSKHLTWLKRHSPYFEKLKNTPFEALPFLDKAKMMAHFDSLNTRHIRLTEAMAVAIQAEVTRDFDQTIGDVTVGLSSGTSGNRGIFLATENERAKWVAEVLQRVLHIKWGKQQKIAFFLRADSKLYQSIRSRAFAFHFFDLAQPIEGLIEKLNSLQADILIAPPSVLLEIAYKIENQSFKHNFTKIISVAEVLEEDIRNRLTLTFGQIIHQVYQATEGFLASTCAHGTLHFHEDLVFIEKKYVDETQSVFHPIITDFTRQTQPIVRYELNDLIHERLTPCPCGSIFMAIDHIEGRSDDVLTFGDKRIFPDFFRYAVLFASSDIEQFQVIQMTESELVVKLKLSLGFDSISLKVQENIAQLLLKNNVTDVRIRVEQLGEHDFLNKFRRIKSLNR
ncbi:MAG: adenylate synthase [Saprospiraceae bacterium]|nr:adenylate synthase [Saprospiraceae bacterium]